MANKKKQKEEQAVNPSVFADLGQDNDAVKESPQPIGFAWKEDAEVVLTGKEFRVLNTLVENAFVIKNLLNQRHINSGVFKPFFKEDLKEDGGLKDDFFENTKKESND